MDKLAKLIIDIQEYSPSFSSEEFKFLSYALGTKSPTELEYMLRFLQEYVYLLRLKIDTLKKVSKNNGNS